MLLVAVWPVDAKTGKKKKIGQRDGGQVRFGRGRLIKAGGRELAVRATRHSLSDTAPGLLRK